MGETLDQKGIVSGYIGLGYDIANKKMMRGHKTAPKIPEIIHHSEPGKPDELLHLKVGIWYKCPAGRGNWQEAKALL